MRFLLALLLALRLAAAPDNLPQVFQQASQALSTGDLAAAERGFQQILKSQPNNIGALGNLGVTYTRMERPADAVAVYQRALKVAPSEPLLHLNIGLAYLKQDDYTSARPHFQHVLARLPDHRQAKELLATTRLYTGDIDKGVSELEELKQTGSSAVSYFLAIGYMKQGNREKSEAAMSELFRTLPAARANFLHGRALYEATLFDQAAEALEKARALESTLPGLNRELGKVYVSLRRSDEAKKALEAALRENSADAEALYFLGATLVQEGTADPGVALLEKARDARPNFWGAYYYLGKAKFDAGQLSASIALLQKAVELKPDETSVWYLLSRAHRKAGNPELARKAAERLTTLQSEKRKPE